MREAEELSQVVGDIHDASLDPALWPTAIESICRYVGAASAGLHSQDAISRAATCIASTKRPRPNGRPTW